jgi:UDP-glucose:(heptosyl)LPS alpha-1,3-glucosyltransferase
MELVHHDHPDLLVAMVGNDQHPYAVHLREYVAAHGLADHVRLVPFTDDLSTWWAAADATALTPTAESEALSGSLVEGMAHGLPTLVTRVGDAALLVDEGRSGWLAEADAVGSLVRALRRAGEAELSTWRGYGSYAAERAAREGSREAALDRVTALFTSCARP